MNRALLTSLVFLIMGFFMSLSGFYSGDAVLITLGVALGFAGSSSYLTLYVTSRRLKRAIEVVFAVLTPVIVAVGYMLTGNVILGIVTTLIASSMFIAFMLSRLLPKIQNKKQKSKRSALLEREV